MDRVAVVRNKMRKYSELTDLEIVDALAEIEQTIKNYCHVASVPVELYFVMCNMAVDLLKYDIESNKESADVLDAFDASDVQTVNIGDTSITFGDKYRSNARGRTLMSHQAKLDRLIMDYTAQLNNFRRIW